METNAQLFAVLKRDEIRDTIEGITRERPWEHTTITDRQRRDMVALINHPRFWPEFDANYAERLLGEGA